MLTTKERWQEVEKIVAVYMGLPEKEITMVLAYSTALRDRALLEQTHEVTADEPEMVGK